MIAKRIPRDKATSNAARLARYVVAARGGIDPRSWTRTADYVLAANEDGSEKVGGVRVTNCQTDDPAAATLEIMAVQAINTRSKADKTYHLVFSFPPGEQPPFEVLHAIEDELCAAIGYADHQRISAVHVDTDHLHVHVAINKVHPTGFQNIEPYFDKRRLMEACERLEIEHGLTRTNHGIPQENENVRDHPNHTRDHDGEQHRVEAGRATVEQLHQSYNLSLAERPPAKTLDDLRILPGGGVVHDAHRSVGVLPGDAPDDLAARAAEATDVLRRPRDGARADGSGGARLTPGRAGDMEAHSGIESIVGLVRRELAEPVRVATSWDDVHAAFAAHGLEIRPRGAGLVIGSPETGRYARASLAGRDLALQAMTNRLGPYTPPKGPRVRPYEARPRHQHASTAPLFAQYQRERQAAQQKRTAGNATLRADAAAFSKRLKAWRQAERAMLKASGASGVSKRLARASMTASGHAALNQQRAEVARQREALRTATSLPSWQDWLAQKAQDGDMTALEVLRSRADQAQRLRGDLLRAPNLAAAKHIVMRDVRHLVQRDGSVTYKTADGGTVIDRADQVQARTSTAGAAFIALTLAAERFKGQALSVEGSAEFKAQVAEFAGRHGVAVTFSDPGMERMRVEAEQKKAAEKLATTPAPAPTQVKPVAPGEKAEKTGVSSSPVIDAWIKKRNETAGKVSGIDYIRLWKSTDAGAAKYQGRRKMEDGSEVLLLSRGSETLVLPASSRVVAKASRFKVGQTVTLDGRGRFVGTTQAKGR